MNGFINTLVLSLYCCSELSATVVLVIPAGLSALSTCDGLGFIYVQGQYRLYAPTNTN